MLVDQGYRLLQRDRFHLSISDSQTFFNKNGEDYSRTDAPLFSDLFPRKEVRYT